METVINNESGINQIDLLTNRILKGEIMEKKRCLLAICVTILISAIISSNAAAVVVTQNILKEVSPLSAEELIGFGDSLVDNGNLYYITGGTQPPDPPYWQGRFSNGPVWVEYLADFLGLNYNFQNYAVGGSTTSDVLNLQIPSYTSGNAGSSNSLYVLQAGNNDFLNYDPTNPSGWIAPAIGNIYQSINVLYANGGRNFVVANAPNYGITPLLQATNNPDVINGATQLAMAFNDALYDMLDQYEIQTDASFYVVDFFGISTQVVACPSCFGFEHIGPYLPDMIGDPDDYIFYDDIHPTTAMHLQINGSSQIILEIPLDIKPTSCPNPLNTRSRGVLPVAVLGTEDLDVSTIDVASIRLAGVAPMRSAYEDVSSPIFDEVDCVCTTEGPDGYLDLTLKFDIQEILAVLGEVENGQELQLDLTGTLFDETEIEGTDCVLIRHRDRGERRPARNTRIR